jgi:hypothetical protein
MHSFRPMNKAANHPSIENGEIKGARVTPPSPRSLRRGSRSGLRGRGRSASLATNSTLASESEEIGNHRATFEDSDRDQQPEVFPITPESSLRLGGCTTDSVVSSASTGTSGGETSLGKNKQQFTDIYTILFGCARNMIAWGQKYSNPVMACNIWLMIRLRSCKEVAACMEDIRRCLGK